MAAGARDAAVKEFELAVKDAQHAGRVRKPPAKPYAVAHLVTAIVDGFLFHAFEEHVGREKTVEELLDDLADLFDLALTGLALPGHEDAVTTTPAGT